MKLIFYFLVFYISFPCASFTQVVAKKFESKDSLYNANIKKSKIYGVYIPRDIDDAMIKLMELTSEEARKPMLNADEVTFSKKLRFGLGRWMEYNWNFAEGSRLSDYLRQKGLSDTDDMVTFMLITFHRYVTKKPLDSDKLVATLAEARAGIIKERQAKLPIIQTETRKIPKKE